MSTKNIDLSTFVSNNRAKFLGKVYSAIGGRLAVAQLVGINALTEPAAQHAAWTQITEAIRLVFNHELAVAKAAWEPKAAAAKTQFETLKAAGPVSKPVGDAIWAPANELKADVRDAEQRLARFEAELAELIKAEPAMVERANKQAAEAAAKAS